MPRPGREDYEGAWQHVMNRGIDHGTVFAATMVGRFSLTAWPSRRCGSVLRRTRIAAPATIIPTGFTAELAASGEVELAVQQISELLMVPGIEVIGPLPAGAESITMFSGGILASSSHTELAAALLAHLRSQRAVAALNAAGLRAAP